MSDAAIKISPGLKMRTSGSVSFADVAHQTLIFDREDPTEALVLRLIDTRWVQRLRLVSQTGNTKLVYMFAEHSRFGHSLGVAYLALLLMKHLRRISPDQVAPYQMAVAAAALLHDIGHIAPGSHLAERVWSGKHRGKHELVGTRIIQADPELQQILSETHPDLPRLVCEILSEGDNVPPWTKEIISGSGWNADRGNWSIVDSTMCAVTYGRYNVLAIIDAFRLTPDGRLVLQESRLDALTHFFVARDSMYRQIYQHRALQAVDALTENLLRRTRDILGTAINTQAEAKARFESLNIFADDVFIQLLLSKNYSEELPIETIFSLTEPWWNYHVLRWCSCGDSILQDLAIRLRDRRLFKTIRLSDETNLEKTISTVEAAVKQAGLDPRYYCVVIEEADTHRGKPGEMPEILLDSGQIVPVVEVEPLIAQILMKPASNRRWLAVPQEIKQKLGYIR